MYNCSICSKEFKSERALSGHKRVHSQVVGKQRINKAKVTRPVLLCQYCGIEKEYDPKSSTGKYCSIECSAHGNRQRQKERVEAGEAGSAALKQYLINKNGYKCEKCGISDWCDEPISLHLDHIDGNSDNNRVENGRILCPNCHSQTETFSGRNKKNTKRNSYLQDYKRENKQKRSLVRDEGFEPPTNRM